MGGKSFFLVVKRGQPAEILESCIKCSSHWQWVQKFALTENMRVQDGEGEFSEWLLKLGNGTIPVKEEDPFKGCIEIPNQCIIRENESIVEKIFGDADQNDYSKLVILTPTNVDSLSINEEVLECLPGEVKTYLSADQIDTDDLNERNNLPVEYLNSLTPSGMPPEMVVWMSHRLNGGLIHTPGCWGTLKKKQQPKGCKCLLSVKIFITFVAVIFLFVIFFNKLYICFAFVFFN